MARYVEIKTNTQYGMSAISSKVVCDIANGVLEDLSGVSFCLQPEDKNAKNCEVCITKPLLCRMSDTGATLYIHVHTRKNLNASAFCKNLQKEISEQVNSMLELKKFDVQVKIDGII